MSKGLEKLAEDWWCPLCFSAKDLSIMRAEPVSVPVRSCARHVCVNESPTQCDLRVALEDVYSNIHHAVTQAVRPISHLEKGWSEAAVP